MRTLACFHGYLCFREGGWLVDAVLAESPAEEAGVVAGERLERIGRTLAPCFLGSSSTHAHTRARTHPRAHTHAQRCTQHGFLKQTISSTVFTQTAGMTAKVQKAAGSYIVALLVLPVRMVHFWYLHLEAALLQFTMLQHCITPQRTPSKGLEDVIVHQVYSQS